MAYDQIESKLPLGYEYIGKQVVKNISKPLHAYRVVIDPEDRSRQKTETERSEFKRKHPHSRHEFKGERFEQHFQQVKGHLKDFAKDIKEDEQLGKTFQEIKGRFRTFADDMAGSPEHRHQALHSLINNNHVRLFIGAACFLFLINAFTSFGRWWFQYPLVSIGLAVYLHWLKTSFFSSEKVKAIRQRLLQKELARLDPKSRDSEEGKELAEKQAHARVHFYNHLYIYVGVNAFLVLINLLSNPFSWWFHFPLLGWGIALFIHWMKMGLRLPDKKHIDTKP
jgi:Flp pilus assembly protein TadB